MYMYMHMYVRKPAFRVLTLDVHVVHDWGSVSSAMFQLILCTVTCTVETMVLDHNFFFSTSMFGIGFWKNCK